MIRCLVPLGAAVLLVERLEPLEQGRLAPRRLPLQQDVRAGHLHRGVRPPGPERLDVGHRGVVEDADVLVPVGRAAPVVVPPEPPLRPALISSTATVAAARNAAGAP